MGSGQDDTPVDAGYVKTSSFSSSRHPDRSPGFRIPIGERSIVIIDLELNKSVSLSSLPFTAPLPFGLISYFVSVRNCVIIVGNFLVDIVNFLTAII